MPAKKDIDPDIVVGITNIYKKFWPKGYDSFRKELPALKRAGVVTTEFMGYPGKWKVWCYGTVFRAYMLKRSQKLNKARKERMKKMTGLIE